MLFPQLQDAHLLRHIKNSKELAVHPFVVELIHTVNFQVRDKTRPVTDWKNKQILSNLNFQVTVSYRKFMDDEHGIKFEAM